MNIFWEKKRVFITGATGLVGSWLMQALIDRKADVVALIHDTPADRLTCRGTFDQQVEFVSGSLEDLDALERAIHKYEIDTVFHLGAQTIVGTALRNPLGTFEANIRGTYHLLEACRRSFGLVRRIVVASSDKAYGSSDRLPYVEDMPLCGKHPYDVSKSCTDLLALSYAHTYRLPVAIARCGNIYGGRDMNWSRIVPGSIRSFLLGTPPLIRSNGLYTRDYVYVEDAVEAYLLLAEQLDRSDVEGEAFNFGPEAPSSVLEIVGAIQGLMGCEHIQANILGCASNEIEHQSLNADKAKERLRWRSRYPLKEGLKRTIDWYKNYLIKGIR